MPREMESLGRLDRRVRRLIGFKAVSSVTSSARIILPALVAGFFLALLDPIRGEISDEQKKALFLKSSSGTSTASPHPPSHKHPSPSPSPHHAFHKSTHGKKKSAHHPSPSPTPHHETTSSSSTTTQAVASAPANQHPSITLPVSAIPLPHGATPSAPITIEKSGVETAEGLEPTPSPQKEEGFWSRVFGSHKTYNYLSASTRAAIDHAPVRRGRWKYIVVHNSGTREGNARVFEIYHLRVRHMKNGLAYHFVIGDGHGSGDGRIEIGHRWTAQLNGGHVASDYLNDIALGICLVGDFNRDQPTKAQIGALEELVAYLRDRVGKSQGRRAIVYAHKEINPRPTDCPGEHFPYNWLHATFGNAH